MRPTRPRAEETRRREEQALELHIGGASCPVIAEALGLSRSGARKAVTRALSRLVAESQYTPEQQRGLEVARLDRLLLGVWAKAKRGDERAARLAVQIGKRRAELLGLDRRPRPDGRGRTEATVGGRDDLTAAQVATAMAEALVHYQAGATDSDQLRHEILALEGLLEALEQATLEAKLDRIEAALEDRRGR